MSGRARGERGEGAGGDGASAAGSTCTSGEDGGGGLGGGVGFVGADGIGACTGTTAWTRCRVTAVRVPKSSTCVAEMSRAMSCTATTNSWTAKHRIDRLIRPTTGRGDSSVKPG